MSKLWSTGAQLPHVRSLPLTRRKWASKLQYSNFDSRIRVASAETEEIEEVKLWEIQDVSYQEGTYKIVGKLRSAASIDLAYQVLTDYASLPRVFHNVESCSIKQSADGDKCLIQECNWKFLVFRGTFVTHLQVEEMPESCSLRFSLVESAFMKHFIGSWELREGESEIEILHTLAVAPAIAPPQKIGELTKNIFVSQVTAILHDLHSELESRLI